MRTCWLIPLLLLTACKPSAAPTNARSAPAPAPIAPAEVPSAPAKADPQPPTAEAPPPPASTHLNPRFIKGQRAVLRQLTQRGTLPGVELPSRIDVEVIEADATSSVLTWAVSVGEKPEGLADEEWAAVKKMLEGQAIPKLELVVDHTTGDVTLRDWQRVRDEVLQITEQMVRRTKADIDEQTLAKAMNAVRSMTATQEGAEALILAQVTPYFACLHHEIAVGEQVSDEMELPFPSQPPQMMPADRTVSVKADGPSLRVAIDIRLNRERSTAVFQEFLRGLQSQLRPGDPPLTIESLDVHHLIEMSFDPSIGWPTDVRLVRTSKMGSVDRIDKMRWTVIETPAVKKAQ